MGSVVRLQGFLQFKLAFGFTKKTKNCISVIRLQGFLQFKLAFGFTKKFKNCISVVRRQSFLQFKLAFGFTKNFKIVCLWSDSKDFCNSSSPSASQKNLK